MSSFRQRHEKMMWTRIALGAALLLGTGLMPLAGNAQVPSYAQPGATANQETIQGTIAAVPGPYALRLQDVRGFVDDVRMDAATVMPPGFALAPGTSVTIQGYNAGDHFQATAISASSAPVSAAPYPAYAYPVYPYPVYAYPAPYYGPVLIAPSFRFGFRWR